MGDKIKIDTLKSWGIDYEDFLVIAGPCSAESEEQMHQTAMGLSGKGVHVLRAGLWKPRTRPGCFEGVGEEGLKWLVEAGRAAGLKTTTEVASPAHVEACLKAGVDVLWIGARTTVNPFSVQPIADALKGADIPVMVKNPINPDMELWLGAMERLNQCGVDKIAAIHRGFTAYKKSRFRNKPNWKLPIELRRRVPAMPMICDPSHIAGSRSLVPEVAQTALDLTFDGLMIESHVNPDVALSDAKQQLKPDALAKLLAKLKTKLPEAEKSKAAQQIESMRRILDELDKAIIALLAQRMSVSTEMGHQKKLNDIAIYQPKRWKKTLQTRIKLGKELGLDDDFMLRIYQYIHEESIRHQEKGSGK